MVEEFITKHRLHLDEVNTKALAVLLEQKHLEVSPEWRLVYGLIEALSLDYDLIIRRLPQCRQYEIIPKTVEGDIVAMINTATKVES